MGTHLLARAVVRRKHPEGPLPRALRRAICILHTAAQFVSFSTGDSKGKLLAVGGGGEDEGHEDVGEVSGGEDAVGGSCIGHR
jgi:hypothetical protein